ncbi:MAG: hypothetical protein ACTSVI_12810 [Promethearchaeota archaeon]
MHVNAHLASGVTVTLFLVHFFNIQLSNFEIAIAISFACIMDGDFIFNARAPQHNHRKLISHSFFPGSMLILASIVVGLILVYLGKAIPSLVTLTFFCGINLLVHVMLDSIDWGVNLLSKRRLYGPRILLKKLPDENYFAMIEHSKNTKGYFFKIYYNDKTMVVIEIILFFLMILAILFTWDDIGKLQAAWSIPAYVAFLGFHLYMFRKAEPPILKEGKIE